MAAINAIRLQKSLFFHLCGLRLVPHSVSVRYLKIQITNVPMLFLTYRYIKKGFFTFIFIQYNILENI